MARPAEASVAATAPAANDPADRSARGALERQPRDVPQRLLQPGLAPPLRPAALPGEPAPLPRRAGGVPARPAQNPGRGGRLARACRAACVSPTVAAARLTAIPQ